MAVMEDFSAIFRIAGPGLDRDELVVPGSGLSLGRSGDNDFVLGSGEISRRHMRFVWEDGEIYVTDLNSSNGVYVNDQRIRADVPYKLSVGEVLRAGPFTLTLERIISPKRRRTEAPPPAPEPKPEPAPPVAAAPEPEPEPVAEPEPPVAAAPAPEPEPASAPEPEPAPEPEAELKTVPPAAAAEPAPQPEPEPEPEPPPVARPKGRAPKAEEPVLLFTPVTPEETAPVPEPEPEVKTAPPAAAKPQPEPEPEPAPPPRKSAPRAREEAPAESAPYIPPTAAAPAEPLPPIERVPFTVGGVPGRFRPPPTGNGHREEYPLGLPRDASTWMKYLPEIYSEDDFLGRYLLIFEAMMSPSIWALDSFDLYLTPETAPLDWVRWMAGWFDILIVPDLPEDRQRAVLQQVGWIFKRRGTRAGLERMLELYFGVRPEISEDPKQPFTFVVRLALSESRVKLGPEIVDTIIRAHKPAHTAYRLELT